MGKLIDLTGKQFGRLTVICRSGSSKNESMWLCRCQCGEKVSVGSSSLRRGLTRSCGCIASERMLKRHIEAGDRAIPGADRSKLYYIWRGMLRRCCDSKSSAYKWYGGRGISVCKEWADSYEVFRKWALEHGYKEGLSIDRIDNDGDYAPSNCQWITRSENSRKAIFDQKKKKG